MESFERKKHWENIYETKKADEVSWYEPVPETSLDYFKSFKVPETAKITDIGGGDSFLVDHLLKRGYKNISVLDISEAAIERAKKRLGESASEVNWIVADAAKFEPEEEYDFWHDRAAFHFLTDPKEISDYIRTAEKAVSPGGILVIGTFSEEGPTKCSGIEIRQYSKASLSAYFSEFFEKKACKKVDHVTPSGSIQKFIFCSFRKP